MPCSTAHAASYWQGTGGVYDVALPVQCLSLAACSPCIPAQRWPRRQSRRARPRHGPCGQMASLLSRHHLRLRPHHRSGSRRRIWTSAGMLWGNALIRAMPESWSSRIWAAPGSVRGLTLLSLMARLRRAPAPPAAHQSLHLPYLGQLPSA